MVILNYNGGTFVLRSVGAVVATEWPLDRLEVVVIDNASTDESAARIAAQYPRVDLRLRTVNTGFVANNDAFSDLADVDYVALVNNDAFVEPGWLTPLVAALEADDGLGAVCPKVLFSHSYVEVEVEGLPTDDALVEVLVDGQDMTRFVHGLAGFAEPHPADGAARKLAASTIRMQVPAGETAELRFSDVAAARVLRLPADAFDVVNNAGNVLTTNYYGADRGFHERDGPAWDVASDVFAFCGNGVVFRSRFLAEVGGFDERLFAYYEDLELSWRGREAGWRYQYVPEARVRHMHGATAVAGSRLHAVLNERNRLVVLFQYLPWDRVAIVVVQFLTATASYAVRDVLRPLTHAQRPRPEILSRRLAALAGFLRLLPSSLRLRRARPASGD